VKGGGEKEGRLQEGNRGEDGLPSGSDDVSHMTLAGAFPRLTLSPGLSVARRSTELQNGSLVLSYSL
jgi:hypothetical protein